MSNTLPNVRSFLNGFHLDLDNGTAWLNDQRLLVFHADWYFDLRERLIEQIGQKAARDIFFELGHGAGVRDALTAMKINPNADIGELLSIGGEFHAFQGGGRPSPILREWDETGELFKVEFIWKNSIEAELTARSKHQFAGGACWMYAGHSSGFMSTIVNREIIVKEVACVAHGSDKCRCIGQYAHQWVEEPAPLPRPQEVNGSKEQFVRLHSSEGPEPPDKASEDSAEGLIGNSAAFRFTLRSARRVGKTLASVLLLGESGVGKSTIARYIHNQSERAKCPFMEVNCAAIPENLLEAELFGVERGAFTGANATRTGRFEEAAGGTLFLDEVSLLTPAAQGKLLRVLQNQEYERLGSSKTRRADVRVIAASNEELAEAAATGSFRSDLYYRLNVFPIMVPSLRSRPDDLPLLLNFLLKQLAGRYKLDEIRVTAAARRALMHHDWPGNIRELENVLERAVILKDPDEDIDLHHIYVGNLANTNNTGLHWLGEEGRLSKETAQDDSWIDHALNMPEASLAEIERKVFTKALEAAEGNIIDLCGMLGLTRAQVDYRLRKWELNSHVYRPTASRLHVDAYPADLK